ncbi:paired amphipathic helix protein Sin3-like 6 [Phragmites australis]|uniref:paired amphipathic helix protein Sin3-like 6 n=1 Tax=Phragmites australis TaxID=29695 RepID=UPI002D7A0392|nr:paired amphipathic helix protein Sin3-like 6 [Phragmites australis]
MEAVRFLILAKEELGDYAYNELIKTVQEIVKRSANPDSGITIQKCEEILSEVFDGQTRLLKSFNHFLEARDPFHDDMLPDPNAFLAKVKASPYICDEDYNDFLTTLCQFRTTRTMTVEDVYEKAKRIMRQCPELIEIFKTYLPPHLRVPVPNKQYCGIPKTSPMNKAVLSFTPDANHSLDGIRMKATNIKNNVSQMDYHFNQNHKGIEYSFRQKHTQRIPDSFQMPTREGNGESLHAEEYEGDKIDPLPDWSPSRENELPPKVDLNICPRCTPSCYLLPENCSTLQSSYRTELGRSIFNDTLVCSTSGSEGCFKFRTKNKYEEKIFKCEDDMFESDMLLQRFRATADFIGNLQDHVDSDTKIQEHLSPLHRRCIEQLYDDCGLDVLDALSESQYTSASLVVLHSRLNQKMENLSEARLSLHKMCSNIIANNYHRSLDHRSSSFKQLDTRRMSTKALLAEAKEITRSVSDDATDLRIHEDIDSIVRDESRRSFPSEHKLLMMIWTKLVHPFVSANCQLPELNVTVAPREDCDGCGLSKNFLNSIHDALLANNFSFSSKRGECFGNTCNKSSSIHDEIEGEFIPDIENIQLDAMLGPVNRAANYDVAAPSGDGPTFRCPELSVCDHGNKSKGQHESREGSNIEMYSLAYFKRISELPDVKGGIPCCSLVVLCRLHQILYERLLVAKVLSREASSKALSRGSRSCDLYAEFQVKLFELLEGSTDNSNFEKYCLNFLGPRSYILFTLDKLICQLMKELCSICPADEDNFLIQPNEKVRRPNLSKDLLHHQNARSSPARPTNGSLEQDREEREKGRKPLDDTVKPTQNHFQRRKKPKLENGAAS